MFSSPADYQAMLDYIGNCSYVYFHPCSAGGYPKCSRMPNLLGKFLSYLGMCYEFRYYHCQENGTIKNFNGRFGCTPCTDCSFSLDIDKSPLKPGDTAVVSAIADTGCERYRNWSNLNWSVFRQSGTASVKISSSGKTAVLTEISGSGWITIRAQDPYNPSCFKEAQLFVGCDLCETGQCKKGGGAFELSSIDVRFNLGRTDRGRSAGSLRLFADTADPINATPQALQFAGFSRDVQLIHENGAIRQIVAPEAFLDIEIVDDYQYHIRFYHIWDMGELTDQGRYEPVDGADPFVTWQVENPDASDVIYHRLKFTEIRDSYQRSYEYVRNEDSWSLIKGDGLQLIKHQQHMESGDRVVVETIVDDTGAVASTTEKRFRQFDWSAELIQQVEDPFGAALTTIFGYVDDPQKNGYGNLGSQINPDGSWIRYEYDEMGRKTLEVSSWLDSPVNSPASEARAVYYDYTAQDTLDSLAFQDERQPRKIIETIQAITVSQSYWVYQRNEAGELTQIEQKCTDPSAAYGTSGNLETVKSYFAHDGGPGSGRLKHVIHPDKRMDSFTYEQGHYDPVGTENEWDWNFVEGAGNHIRKTVVHGTVQNPGGIYFKSTQEVFIENRFGDVIADRTGVYTPDFGYQFVSQSKSEYDEFGRLTKLQSHDSRQTQITWGCCGKLSETDKNNVTTQYTNYDALGRLLSFQKEASMSIGAMTIRNEYDGASRIVSETIKSADGSLSKRFDYDEAGRLVQKTDEAGLTTDYTYFQNGMTMTHPGGVTETVEHYLEGRIKKISGTASVQKRFSYGVDVDSTRWVRIEYGSAGCSLWEKYGLDMLGRIRYHQKPGYEGLETTQYVYDDFGRLDRIKPFDTGDVIYAYDALGRLVKSGLDADRNSILQYAGSDRITETDIFYTQDHDWYEKRETKQYAEAGSAVGTTVKTELVRKSGLGVFNSIGEIHTQDIFGNITIEKTFLSPDAPEQTRQIAYPDSSFKAKSLWEKNLLTQHTDKSTRQITYGYDGFERLVSVSDSKTGQTVIHYNDKGQLDTVETPGRNHTQNFHDPVTGRLIVETDAPGHVTRYDYNARGQLTHVWGDSVYPQKIVYDDLGRIVERHGFRGGTDWHSDTWPQADGDITRYYYQDGTGLLTEVEQPDGTSVCYTYTTGGRLKTRSWSRMENSNAVTATYSYDSGTGELIRIAYSDNTPDIEFSYARLGRLLQISDAAGIRQFTYNPETLQMESETVSGLYERIITKNYALSGVLGRPTGISIQPDYQKTIGYDDFGRINAVGVRFDELEETFDYTYGQLPDLITGVSGRKNYGRKTSYDVDSMLPVRIENRFDDQVVSCYDYSYDALGRIDAVSNSGKALSEAYLARIQDALWLENAIELDEGFEVKPDTRSYQYDHAGNRTDSVDWDDLLEQTRHQQYFTNSVNGCKSQLLEQLSKPAFAVGVT